jgi:hypothetical protein
MYRSELTSGVEVGNEFGLGRKYNPDIHGSLRTALLALSAISTTVWAMCGAAAA